MILYLAIACGTVLACEIALRLHPERSLSTLSRTAGRATSVLRSSAISDVWKERVLPAYSGRIMRASLVLLVSLLLIIAPLAVLAALATGSLVRGGEVLLQPVPLVLMIVVGAVYIIVRRKLAR